MPRTHIVQQGEHATSISRRYGFDDYTTVWHHPENAALRSKRNPNVLSPGDPIHIPEKDVRPVSVDTGRTHTFVLRRRTLMLRLRLLDFRGRPIAGAPCQVALERGEEDPTTDAEGRLELSIEDASRRGTLTTPTNTGTLHIGSLDPIDEELGFKTRLVNMGYLAGPADDADSDDELALALEEFQADQGLPTTGVLDDATEARLLDAYGC